MNYNLDYFLKEMLKGVSLQDIAEKDEKWCLSNYYLISGCLLAGSFKNEVLNKLDTFQYDIPLTKSDTDDIIKLLYEIQNTLKK